MVKAAGLAKGKGVIMCNDPVEAMDAVRAIMEKKMFGSAGDTVVIEERLDGPGDFAAAGVCGWGECVSAGGGAGS